MRKNVLRALCVALAVGLTGGVATGCKVSVSAGSKKPKPAPPPPAPAPDPAPAPKPKRKGGRLGGFKFKVSKDGKIQLPGPVLFKSGTAELLPESDAILEIVEKYMKKKTEITKLRIEGHTDTDGEDAANQTLSENRAMSVVGWLKGKGIECGRMVPVGFGEKKLVVLDEKTPDDKAKNRRVVFINAELKGKAIGGLPVDGGGKIAGDPCK